MSFPTSPTKLQTPNLTRLRITKAKLNRFFVAVKLLIAHSKGQRHFQLCQPKAPEAKELPNSQTRTGPYQQNWWLKPKRFRLKQQNLPIQTTLCSAATLIIIVRKPKLSKTDSWTENGSLRLPDVIFNTKKCLERLSDWIVTYIQINCQYTT